MSTVAGERESFAITGFMEVTDPHEDQSREGQEEAVLRRPACGSNRGYTLVWTLVIHRRI